MKVVIPMAGRGSRFSEKGFLLPKPLIKVADKPMIFWALESIRGLPVTDICFVMLQEHEEEYNVRQLLQSKINATLHFVMINEVTEGQLCTVLAAKEYIDGSDDILIAASDTLVIGNLKRDILSANNYDGIISVKDLPGERWSFAKTDESGKVIEVSEKKRISNHASTGLYYFRKGSEFINFSEEIILRKEKTLGEYYVMPVYQKMINAGLNIGISLAENMWDMGTPESKEFFEKNYTRE